MESPKVVVLRPVVDADLSVLFEQQRDPEANAMAAFPARERDAFVEHWQTVVNGRDDVVARAIEADGALAGQVGCFVRDGRRLVGYWLGREFWGRGIATRALAQLVAVVPERPLHAWVALHNKGSIRVLEKCGFERVGEPQPIEDYDGVLEQRFVLE